MSNRKSILHINKKSSQELKELLEIRGDYKKCIDENINIYSNPDKCIKLCSKKDCNIFMGVDSINNLTIGRIYNNEIIDLIKFNILDKKSINNFNTISPELFMKYSIVFINLSDKRLENILVDLFHQKSNKINIDFKYSWIIECIDDIIIMKYVRILKDNDYQEVGPYFKLQISDKFYSEDIFNKSMEYKKSKSIKNVSKTDLKDTIGKVYIDRQDLKDIKIRKSVKKAGINSNK